MTSHTFRYPTHTLQKHTHANTNEGEGDVRKETDAKH